MNPSTRKAFDAETFVAALVCALVGVVLALPPAIFAGLLAGLPL
jgi:hypothetical protein